MGFLAGAGAIIFVVLGAQYLHEQELRRRLPFDMENIPEFMKTFVKDFLIGEKKCTPEDLVQTGKSIIKALNKVEVTGEFSMCIGKYELIYVPPQIHNARMP